MTDPIGARLRIDYFDHNESFATILPRSGRVTRRLRSMRGVDNFFVLKLDEPFEYAGQRHESIVIRSRWQGYEIGDPEQTSVFVVLVPDPALLEREPIDVDKLNHVAWGMATTIEAAKVDR